ncbi:MAG: hypothetical protein DI535_03765 [Citrobacter freundii]|nr:MAG: hypothetical protein DI535_03765 [Citrobacter freundii]
MAHSTIKHKARKTGKFVEETPNSVLDRWIKDAEHKVVPVDQISFSQLNYRKIMAEEALKAFALELAQHGIISPLLVRKLQDDNYELVAGERRLRAAKIAGIDTVPVLIAILTDDQVIELQLSENLQRENPHPLHEAQAIGAMQMTGKTIAEIATRLGRKPSFVYSRLRLLQLIESFQEMLFAEKISLNDSYQIAGLSAASQTELFEARCTDWKKQKHFQLGNLDYFLYQYQYDLKRSPFNTKDKTLLPEVGACTNCQYNSATLKTLFPEEAKQAVCRNKECYAAKCNAHINLSVTNALLTYQPVAWLFRNEMPEQYLSIIESRPESGDMPRHNVCEITVIEEPDAPDESDYMYEYDEDNDEGQKIDESEWAAVQQEYQNAIENYLLHVSSGHYQVGLLLSKNGVKPVYFNLEKPQIVARQNGAVSAKQVQEAIKSGTITPELLRAEIERLKQREKRNAELDREKVQLQVHELFSEKGTDKSVLKKATLADLNAAKFLLYDRLSSAGQHLVDKWLFPNRKDVYRVKNEDFYKRISEMKPEEFTALIRIAIADKSESKYPSQAAGYFLYKTAEEAGLPVAAVELSQSAKAKERGEKLSVRVTEIERKIKQIK